MALYDLDQRSGGVILQKTNLPFENKGVFNPGCVERDGIIHMFYRAMSEGDYSSIGYATFDREHHLLSRSDSPLLTPEFEYESHGLEDPRVVLLDGVYYLFYTAFDGVSAKVAYAESKDLITFKKKGLVSPLMKYSEVLSMLNREKLSEKYFWYGAHYQDAHTKDVSVWEKDFFPFPRKINGKFALLHRVMPGIQFIAVDRLEELQDAVLWKAHLKRLEEHIVLNPELWFETKRIGGGAPPIETPDGWLLIYHGVEEEGHTYHAAAALLDLDDPRKVLGKLREPLFSPAEPWEKKGVVDNVVFPTSALDHNGRLTVYYGAGDDCVAVKSFDMKKLLAALTSSPYHHD